MVKIRLVDKKKTEILQATHLCSQYGRTPSTFHRITLHTHRNMRRICFVLLGCDLFMNVRAATGKSRKAYSQIMLPILGHILHTRPRADCDAL